MQWEGWCGSGAQVRVAQSSLEIRVLVVMGDVGSLDINATLLNPNCPALLGRSQNLNTRNNFRDNPCQIIQWQKRKTRPVEGHADIKGQNYNSDLCLQLTHLTAFLGVRTPTPTSIPVLYTHTPGSVLCGLWSSLCGALWVLQTQSQSPKATLTFIHGLSRKAPLCPFSSKATKTSRQGALGQLLWGHMMSERHSTLFSHLSGGRAL